jgi:Protein of unknown function (DUF1573)
MPFLPRAFGAIGFVSSLAFMIWLGHHSHWSDVAQSAAALKAAEQAVNRELAERRRIIAEEQLRESQKPKPPARPYLHPEIAAHAPYPKVVVENPVFEFGAARVGQSMSHVFHIKNVGPAPLLLTTGPVGCKVPVEDWTRELRVGETADFELKWKGCEATRHFAQAGVIFTNDPERPEIELKVYGSICDPKRSEWDWRDIPLIP